MSSKAFGGAVHPQGPLKIPAGVTLKGDEKGEITVTGTNACFIAETDPEKLPTRVMGLACEVTTGTGLLVLGRGSFSAKEVFIRVGKGVGLVAEGLKRLELQHIIIQPQDEPPLGKRREGTSFLAIDRPLIGMLVSHIKDMAFEDINISAFDGAGAILYESGDAKSAWKTGKIVNTMGVGLYVHGGMMSLDDLRVEEGKSFRSPLLPSVGFILAGEAVVHTHHLFVGRNEGVGIIQRHAQVTHQNLEVSDNGRLGLRFQTGAVASLDHATVEDNHGVGIFVRGAKHFSLVASRVAKTRPLLRGGRGTRLFPASRLGDGLQVVIPPAAVGDAISPTKLSLLGDTFADNARAAILLRGPKVFGARRLFDISGVSLGGTGTWGLVVQGGMSSEDSWHYTMSSGLAEAAPPKDLKVASTVELPRLSRLAFGVIKNDGGAIHTDGTVHIEFNPKGFDPGRP